MEKPLISVIMPVYNAEHFLKDSIESILNQTYKNLQFFIFDDGSSDGSKKIIEDYAEKDDRIKPFYNTQNRGYVYYLNKGIKLSNTKYIARMDADDIAHLERFYWQFMVMEENPDIVVCGTFRSIIDEKGNKYKDTYRLYEDDLNLKVQLLYNSCFTHPSVILRNNELLKAKLYYNDIAPCEDYGLWVELMNSGKFRNIPKNLLKYRKHPTQITKTKSYDSVHMMNCRRNAFQNLMGTELSKEQQALWNQLFQENFNMERNELRELYDLLNYSSSIFNEKYGYNKQFEEFIREKWFYVCTLSSHLGLWVFFFYFSKNRIKNDILLLTKFFIKSLFKLKVKNL